MKEPSTRYHRLLAIDPSTKGFGFAVFEGPKCLVDWGVVRVWAKNDADLLVRAEAIMDRYGPALIVLEDISGTRRGARARKRIDLIARYAESRGVDARFISRADVHAAFMDFGVTKQEIAVAIAHIFPELERHLPRPRKPWMSEDERMNVFDAVALAMTVLDLPGPALRLAA